MKPYYDCLARGSWGGSDFWNWKEFHLFIQLKVSSKWHCRNFASNDLLNKVNRPPKEFVKLFEIISNWKYSKMKISLVFLLVLVAVQLAASFDPIQLRDINTLKLRRDKLTKGKWLILFKLKEMKIKLSLWFQTTGYKPVPQLICQDNDYQNLCRFQPSSATCKNTGFVRGNVIWKCSATMPNKTLGFNHLDVNCEEFPGIPGFVIKDSCCLRYTLRVTGGFAASYLSKILFTICLLIATITFKRSL